MKLTIPSPTYLINKYQMGYSRSPEEEHALNLRNLCLINITVM